MDPFTLVQLASGIITVVAAVVLPLAMVRRKKKPKQLESGQQCVVQIPELESKAMSEPPPPPKPEPTPQPNSGKEKSGVPEKTPLQRAIDMLTSEVEFSQVLRFVGYRVIDEEAIGRRLVESIVPTAGWDIRLIRNLNEIDRLLPEEFAYEDDLFYERLLSGQARVRVPVEVHVITRPIHEEVYEELTSCVYVLLDSSGSMSASQNAWRPPVWKGVVRRVIDKAKQSGTEMVLRLFGDKLLNRMSARESHEYDILDEFIMRHNPNSATNIAAALIGAIKEVSSMGFDVAKMVMISDGVDTIFDPITVRAELDAAGIFLHVIMLGVDNKGLRQCAHSYQIVEPNLLVHPIVKN